MEDRPIRKTIMHAAAACLLLAVPVSAFAEDQIDLLLQRAKVPPDMIRAHAHSDFTEPLGQFLDMLAAGAFVQAKLIQPDACAAWLTTRRDSALTGKVWVWNTEINLDTLCTR